MRKILSTLMIFGFLAGLSGELSAQNFREPTQLSPKTDDGVLTVYPNPSRDVLVVRTKNPAIKVKSVTFYSILGMQVSEVAVNMNSAEINIERLRPGKYLMRYVLSDNTQKVTQIIKQ